MPGPLDDEHFSDVDADLGLYVTSAGALLGAWHVAAGREVDSVGDLALAALAAVLGAFGGFVIGVLVGVALLAVYAIAVAPACRWWQDRRFVRSSAFIAVLWTPIITALFWWWPDRVVPAALVAAFGAWAVILAHRRFGESEHLVVEAIPHLGGVAVTTVLGEQVFFGNLLSTTYVAPVLFGIMLWLSWCGWRAMRTARRLSVRAAADIVWSVQLGLLLSLTTAWLANLFSLAPAQVAAIRAVLERAQALTGVHWAYWLTAYTALAVSSFLVLRWPQRFGGSRLPVFGVLNTGKRTLAGINIGLMVALVFTITAVPVSEGVWKRQVEDRYVLETRRIQHAEGEEAAYDAIHQYVTTNRHVATQLTPIVTEIHEAAPPEPGQPVSDSALGIAREIGRFQAATLDVDGPENPSRERAAELPGDPDVSEALAELDEVQQARPQQEVRADRFADAAAAAFAGALDIPDVGRNEVVHILKAYLGGLIEEGRVRDLLYRWARDGGTVPPAMTRLVSVDLPALYDAAHELTRKAAIRAGVDVWAFNATYGLGLTLPGESPQPADVVILARQNHHLSDSSSPCPGCLHAPEDGGTPTGGTSGGGGRRG